MLSENIKAIRESKGLSQDELAAKLNVVRRRSRSGSADLSVPDADALVSLSEALGTSVSVLLGETSRRSQRRMTCAPSPRSSR